MHQSKADKKILAKELKRGTYSEWMRKEMPYYSQDPKKKKKFLKKGTTEEMSAGQGGLQPSINNGKQGNATNQWPIQ